MAIAVILKEALRFQNFPLPQLFEGELAKRTGRSKSFYARQAILEYLDNLEAAYLSDEILKRIDSGEERTYTLDELERELGLAG